MKHESYRSSFLFIGFVLALVTAGYAAEHDGRFNVLFVMCDDLNTHVTTSGYARISTPAFAQLARNGMTFGRAYCQYPVCGPSRASFLHGLYPESTRIGGTNRPVSNTGRSLPSPAPRRFAGSKSGPDAPRPKVTGQDHGIYRRYARQTARQGGKNGPLALRPLAGW